MILSAGSLDAVVSHPGYLPAGSIVGALYHKL